MFLLNGCEKIENQNNQFKFIAFSLDEVSKKLKENSNNPNIKNLGGITRVLGFVIDNSKKDIILVGMSVPSEPEANINDLVVALRSRFIYDEFPLVSIDPDSNTAITKMQNVRFDGHLENTNFGSDFLECDILLKKYSLQLIDTINSVPSYNKLIENDIRNDLKNSGHTIDSLNWYNSEYLKEINNYIGSSKSNEKMFMARFWYYPIDPIIYIYKNNVFLIKNLQIGLKTEEIFSASSTNNNAKEIFSENWTNKMYNLGDKYPKIKKLKLLYDFTAISNVLKDSISLINNFSLLNYFLHTFKIEIVNTPKTYKLEEIYGKASLNNGTVNVIKISGGITFGEEIKMLNFGNYYNLKKIVLESRPDYESLFWELPLNGWIMPNSDGLNLNIQDKNSESEGCFLTCQSVIITPDVKVPKENKNYFGGFVSNQSLPNGLKGVNMKMKIDNTAFKPDKTGRLNKRKDSLIKKRPGDESLNW